MSLTNTDRKVREMNRHFDLICKSRSVDEFEDHFASFLAAARTVTLALQHDLNGNPGFAEWYAIKQKEMAEDELCKFFLNVRNADLHTGKTAITSSMKIRGSLKLSAPLGGAIAINNRGVYEIYNPGKPDQKIVEKAMPDVERTIYFVKPPKNHLGASIAEKNPIEICRIYKEYLENLVCEAKRQVLIPRL